jgi:hypothetical protein
MVRINRFIVALLPLVLVSGTMATVWLVPERQNTIQAMIDDTLVVDGDTVSVWGPPPGQDSPPYTYARVDSLKKSLVIASRCFLPGWQGCQPTWDSVVIDGSNQVGSVVTMTGSESAVPRVVLKGFTITGGRSAYGGGIYCQDVDFLDKSLVVASRCCLPGWQGCEPTWDSVVIKR